MIINASFSLNWVMFLLICSTLAADDAPSSESTTPATDDAAEIIAVSGAVTKYFEIATFSTERSGQLSYVPKEGTRIAPGQVVIQLKDEIAKAAFDTAAKRAEQKGEILVARKSAEAAWQEHQAALDGNKQSPDPANPAYSASVIARLRLNAEAADARILQAQEQQQDFAMQRDQAAAELTALQVKSHFGGIVTYLHRHRGEGVQLGEPVVEVINVDVIRVTGSISLTDAHRAKVGMKVRVTATIPTPTEPRIISGEGVVGYIDVRAATFEDVAVWAEIPNPEGQLREGMQVKMDILLAEPLAPAKERASL